MPVTTLHVEYDRWSPDWERCRDAYNGQRAVKKAGTKYLPMLTEQTEEEYRAYKYRALFYSITSKTVGALVGMALSRPPVLKFPEKMRSHFEENSGTQFYEALGAILCEILLIGRYGILIDRQVGGGRPEIHGYMAESIINWQVNRDGKPFMVVLKESTVSPDSNDEFSCTVVEQYRVLRLSPKGQVAANFPDLLYTGALPIVNETGSDWVYSVSVYDGTGQLVTTTIPTNTGRVMNNIPFYVGNPFGIGFGIAKSPMLDVADINLSHYITSADLEHGRHFTGLPTAVVTGVDATTKLKIGGMTAWAIPDKDADAKYLEFTGQGLLSLENAMKEKERQMASLSSRLLDNSANGSEAADAIKLRYMSESASLSSIARTAEAMCNLAYKTIAAMEDLNPDEVSIGLEKEFHNVRIQPSELVKMTESYLTGGMSVETYVFNLRRGDLIAPNRTDEEEIKSLEEAKAEALAAAEKAAQSKTKPPAQ